MPIKAQTIIKDRWANHPAHLTPTPPLPQKKKKKTTPSHPPKSRLSRSVAKSPNSIPSLARSLSGVLVGSAGEGATPEKEQRMSSSNLEQYLAAALCRHTPAAATATAAPAGAGGGTPDLAAVAIQRQKAAQRARFTTAAFSAEFAPARSLADQYFSRRGTAAARPPDLPPPRFGSGARESRYTLNTRVFGVSVCRAGEGTRGSAPGHPVAAQRGCHTYAQQNFLFFSPLRSTTLHYILTRSRAVLLR